MNKKYKISYAQKRDSGDIIALVHKVIDYSLTEIYPPSAVKWFYNYHSVEHIGEEFDRGADVAVVYDGEKLIGTATYYDDEIKRVFIHPEYQRAGLGKMFIFELEEIARKKKKKYIMLYANPKTWGYYAAKGYDTINIAAEAMENGEYLAYCTMVKYFGPRVWAIEKARIGYAEEILAGQKEAFFQTAQAHLEMDMPPMTESVDEVLHAIQNTCVFVAKADGKIVGSVRGKEKDGACYISRLWVSPGFQGTGIGHALMFAVEDEFFGLDSYELFTGSETPDIIDFYIERGYVETHRKPHKDYEFVFFRKMNALDMLKQG